MHSVWCLASSGSIWRQLDYHYQTLCVKQRTCQSVLNFKLWRSGLCLWNRHHVTIQAWFELFPSSSDSSSGHVFFTLFSLLFFLAVKTPATTFTLVTTFHLISVTELWGRADIASVRPIMVISEASLTTFCCVAVVLGWFLFLSCDSLTVVLHNFYIILL